MDTRTQRLARPAAAAAALILSLALWSCGSKSPTEPASVAPPNGAGNGNLLVVAEVSGSEAEDIQYGGPYPRPASAFVTTFTVSVADPLGAPVSLASVRISTPRGPVTLAEDATVPGTYRAATGTYTEGICVLDVVSGANRVEGAEVVAPDIHTITAPRAKSKVPARGPLTVSWTRAAAAHEAVVASLDYVSPSPGRDDGSSVIPPAGNPVRADQRIEVLRRNRAAITGGRAGSTFTAQIRNTVNEVVAE